jgi:hypothetical protein
MLRVSGATFRAGQGAKRRQTHPKLLSFSASRLRTPRLLRLHILALPIEVPIGLSCQRFFADNRGKRQTLKRQHPRIKK